MKTRLHFVCRGNTYRSRVAEAITRRIGNAHVEVSSSGIETWRYAQTPPDYLRPYTIAIKDQFGLDEYFSRKRTQTTNQLLDQADLIIFMSKDVYRDAAKAYTFNHDKSKTWSVQDVPDLGFDPDNCADQITDCLRAAQDVQKLCEALVHDVTSISWTDVVDEQNQLRGFRLPISWVCQKGLWWRGCHAVITLPNGKYLVEKRSKVIIFSPGMLDITLGGVVDSGETPLQAIQRETKEELGISIPADQFKLIDERKFDAYHPRYKMHTRIFLYTYHGQLDTDTPEIRMQQKEVASVVALSHRQIRRVIRLHRLRGLGPLKTSYRYFDTIVAATRALAR